jgi:hypothetical protein
MSLEQTLTNIERVLERIAVAQEELVRTLQQTINPVVTVTPGKGPLTEDELAQNNMKVVKEDVTVPSQPAAPASAPAPAPAAGLPFNDPASLVKYVTETYQALGPEKGMQIQGVLEKLGHTNVTEVPVDQYGQLHQAIEALKAS